MVQEKYGIDLVKEMQTWNGITDMDTNFTWKMSGAKSKEEYMLNSGCATFFPKIQVPTILYWAEDDPVNDRGSIGIENAKDNEFMIITSNRYGSHMCAFNHFFTYRTWLTTPAFEFFDYFLVREGYGPEDKSGGKQKV